MNNVSKDSPKAAQEGPAIVGEETATDLEEARLESERPRHTEPKVDSDLDNKTLLEANGEKARPQEAGKRKRQAERAEEQVSVVLNLEHEPQEKDKSESGETEAEDTMLESDEAMAVAVVATAMKTSKMTLYLSCSNVISPKTFCEVKLQVCLSAHYKTDVKMFRVKCVLQLLLNIVTQNKSGRRWFMESNQSIRDRLDVFR